MTDGFEFFEGTTETRNTEPMITLRRRGLLVLTEAAVELLGADATHVQIGFNTKTKAVALRRAGEKDRGAYRLRHQVRGSARLVDGKKFFAHHGLTVGTARRFDVEQLADGLIGFHLEEKPAVAELRRKTA